MSEPQSHSAPADSEYNAVIVGLHRVHDDLMILRVRLDDGLLSFEPGQYTTLGLGVWEPRIDNVSPAAGPTTRRLIRRAYSMSCPLVGADGGVLRVSNVDFVEFFIALVRRPADDPPQLTPRLFRLQTGSRVYMGPRAHGHFTLAPVNPDDDVVFAATGTGEGPHDAMLSELLARGHRGRIAVVTSVRSRRDLAYAEAHRQLMERFPNYRYLGITTREPENLDAGHPAYCGKRHLQELFATSQISSMLGWRPDPARSHVYLCGSPAMIGLPHRDDAGEMVYPEPAGMVEVLTGLGFALDRPGALGNIHVEKYW